MRTKHYFLIVYEKKTEIMFELQCFFSYRLGKTYFLQQTCGELDNPCGVYICLRAPRNNIWETTENVSSVYTPLFQN